MWMSLRGLIILNVTFLLFGCDEPFAPNIAPSGMFSSAQRLIRPDSVTVFSYDYIGMIADTEYFQFTYRPWDFYTIPGVSSESGSLVLPNGIIRAYAERNILISDSTFNPKGRLELRIMDFTMNVGDSTKFVLQPQTFDSWLILDDVDFLKADTIFKYRVTGYNHGKSNWVYYCSRRRGIIGTFISCGNDKNFVTLSFFGDVNSEDTLNFRHEVTGSCTIEH